MLPPPAAVKRVVIIIDQPEEGIDDMEGKTLRKGTFQGESGKPHEKVNKRSRQLQYQRSQFKIVSSASSTRSTKELFRPSCCQHLEQSATKRRRLFNRQHVQEKTVHVLHGTDMSVNPFTADPVKALRFAIPV